MSAKKKEMKKRKKLLDDDQHPLPKCYLQNRLSNHVAN